MLCYQCVVMRGGVIGVTGKLKGGLFLWCCYNNVVGEILACYEREQGIRRAVIKIHKLRIIGGFL